MAAVRATGRARRCGLAVLAACWVAPGASAQSLKPNEVLSSVSLAALAPPRPVAGADGRVHLAYELLAANPTRLFITLDRVEAVDARANVLGSLAGAALTAMTTIHGGSGATIAPGGSAIVTMDTAFDAGTRVPATIAARMTLTRHVAGADGKPAPFPTDAGIPATVTFTGPPIGIAAAPAVVIEPPLRGPRWFAGNGCCDTLTSHRGAVMAVNGVLRVPERFAIDWLQLQPDLRLFTGKRGALQSYGYFGTEVHAVADGRVVNLYDAAPEQVPGDKPRGIVPENIGGNMLVIDIGGGNYAFFAHLQPGSLRVKLGDRVKRGQVIAMLGNTGNSDAPHLHFHVMNGPSPLDADGLPFVLTRFTVRGTLDDASLDAMVEKGSAGVIKAGAADGPHIKRLPLNAEVVDFPE